LSAGNVWLVLEEGDCGEQVLVAAPAVEVRLALALPLAAAVEQENTITATDQ
jgi:hypothetical protein